MTNHYKFGDRVRVALLGGREGVVLTASLYPPDDYLVEVPIGEGTRAEWFSASELEPAPE